MKTIRELTCINCPIGCLLEVEIEDGQAIKVTGNGCKRGEIYGKKEVTNPTRIVTSSVKVSGGVLNTVSVKTEKDIPKEKIFSCAAALKGIVVKAPINIGDIILANVVDTGVNIVATKKIEKR
ncbi:MAG: DUF1667 domain-containing protein [Clostridiaceae bacterium]